MNTAEITNLSDVAEALAGIVGKQNVHTEAETLKKYSGDTSLMRTRMPDIVVCAANREEIQGVIKIADKNRIPVVPRSSGTGTYGTGIPEEGGIILELSGMKRIPRVDIRNRWALLEPGVTFKELREELDRHGMQCLNPLLPRKDKSVITSVLEREPVITAKTECDEPIRTMEMVWGTGELMRTGAMSIDSIPAEEIPDKTKSDLCSVGGPGIDWWRLMTGCQGSFGVVTIMNIKIFHKPLLQKVVFLPFGSLEDAVMPFYKIQHREIGHECFLLNAYDLAAILAESSSEIPEMAQRLPNYCIILNLWGGQFFPEDRIAYEEKAVNEIALQYKCSVSETINEVQSANARFQRMLNSHWEDEVYWKEQQMGGCIEIVFESGLNRVPEHWDYFNRLAVSAGIDTSCLGMYIQPRQRARVCHVEFHIPCDPDNTCCIENVKKFHKKAAEILINSGAFFYRPYYDWADMIYSRAGYTHETIRKLKKILDPNRTLNPGKLKL